MVPENVLELEIVFFEICICLMCNNTLIHALKLIKMFLQATFINMADSIAIINSILWPSCLLIAFVCCIYKYLAATWRMRNIQTLNNIII